MTLLEACESCRNGDFVSHSNFDANQSMHYYRGTLYYEDGANVTYHFDWLRSQEWAEYGWFVKKPKDEVDIDKLNEMHRLSNGHMLCGSSYEECILE